jgi:tight adherence protein B
VAAVSAAVAGVLAALVVLLVLRPRAAVPRPSIRAVVAPWSRRRQVALADRALPDALEVAARALRSGASLRGAIQEAAAIAPGLLGLELGTVVADAEHGALLAEGLDRWAAARPSPDVRLAAAALALATETGGAAARTLDGVAATLRERRAVYGEVRALATQARVSAAVLGAAPVAFAAVAGSIDPRTTGFLTGTAAGRVCLATGVALDGLGVAWMQRLTRAVAR